MSQNMPSDIDLKYQTLASEILHFDLKPGDSLSENQLCQRFGLSRTPVRSILQRLQENGLVQIIPHKGTIVTRLDYDVVDQLIYERMAVETMVLRDFIQTCTPKDTERVRLAYSRMQQAVAPGCVNASDFLTADLGMHEIWFCATGKPHLWKRLSAVESSYTRFCTLDIIEGKNTQDVLQEHGEMLRLIDERCTDGIEALMRRHLYGGVQRLRGLIYTKYADYFVPLEGDIS